MVKTFVKCLSKKVTQLNTGVELKKQKSEMTELGENNMHISDEGISLVKKFEGCKLEAYQCAAGVWTIGYGSTHGVQKGDIWSQEKAEIMLIDELEEYGKYVEELVTIPLNQCQFDALTSWTFNLGPSNLQSSTMLKVLNSGDYEGVPNQIKRWNKVSGQVNDGLIRRREAEALLFEGKHWEHI
jgi:lysozyme